MSTAGLFMPPTRSRMALASAAAVEKVGFRWFQTFGGVLLVEAQKQIYAGTGALQESRARKRAYVRVIGGTERRTLETDR